MSSDFYDKHVVYKKECANCGHIWIARVPKPVQCPICKSVKWDKSIKVS